MMKKWLAALLAVLTILPTVSCANTNEKEPESGTAENTVPSSSETIAETDAFPAIEKQDYKGATFQMVTLQNEPGNWYYSEELISSGDNVHVLNNTVFEMNTMVEEYLGVNLAFENVTPITTGGEVFTTVQPSLLSGDDTYQLCILHPYYSYNAFISGGYALDFYELEELDLNQPYWNREVMEQLSINGHAYIGLGDICRYEINMLYCNKGLLSDAKRAVPYESVRNKTWTIDEFTALTSGLYKDDGSGKHDNKDTYGFASLWDANGSAFMQAANIYVLARNEEDTFEISMYGERLLTLYEKLLRWSKDESTYLWRFGDKNNAEKNMDFHGNTIYFTLDGLGTQYLNADFEIGMLPLPKYDAAQEEYMHVNWGNNLVVPSTIENYEMVGRVLEMMSYYTRTHVREVYYNDVLQLRVSDAPDDREMVELICNTIVFDPGIAYCDGYNALWNLVYLPTFTILDGKESIAAYYKTNERGTNIALKKLFKEAN